MNIADWIYSLAEKHRAAQSKMPIEEAEIELYNLIFDSEQRKRLSYLAWQKPIKEKRLRGLKAWREWGSLLKSHGDWYPQWLERYIK